MSQATWSREKLGKFPKNLPQFQEEVMKLPEFMEDLGRFLSFFY
jgi:hypothetical protein